MIVKKFVSLFNSKAFKFALMVGLLIASVLIAIAVLLGRQAGNFVIRVQEGDVTKSIAITDQMEQVTIDEYMFNGNTTYYVYENDRYRKVDKTTEVYDQEQTYYIDSPRTNANGVVEGSKLSASGVENMTDYSSKYIFEDSYKSIREYSEVPGSQYIENSVYIYTFYIANTGTGSVGVNAQLKYSGTTKNIDNALRVMTFYTQNGQDHVGFYQKEDTTQVNYEDYLETPTTWSASPAFNDDSMVINYEDGDNFVKYSIIFWLEGNDPDCTDAILGGSIKFDLYLSVNM